MPEAIGSLIKYAAQYIPFKELVHPQTMKTEVRYIEHGCDFHRLARFLETRGEDAPEWSPARRPE